MDTIICAGGIAEKNAMLMQIYADVLKTPLRVTTSQQTCALGAAIGAAYAGGAHATLDDAVAAMTGLGGGAAGGSGGRLTGGSGFGRVLGQPRRGLPGCGLKLCYKTMNLR